MSRQAALEFINQYLKYRVEQRTKPREKAFMVGKRKRNES